MEDANYPRPRVDLPKIARRVIPYTPDAPLGARPRVVPGVVKRKVVPPVHRPPPINPDIDRLKRPAFAEVRVKSREVKSAEEIRIASYAQFGIPVQLSSAPGPKSATGDLLAGQRALMQEIVRKQFAGLPLSAAEHVLLDTRHAALSQALTNLHAGGPRAAGDAVLTAQAVLAGLHEVQAAMTTDAKVKLINSVADLVRELQAMNMLTQSVNTNIHHQADLLAQGPVDVETSGAITALANAAATGVVSDAVAAATLAGAAAPPGAAVVPVAPPAAPGPAAPAVAPGPLAPAVAPGPAAPAVAPGPAAPPVAPVGPAAPVGPIEPLAYERRMFAVHLMSPVKREKIIADHPTLTVGFGTVDTRAYIAGLLDRVETGTDLRQYIDSTDWSIGTSDQDILAMDLYVMKDPATIMGEYTTKRSVGGAKATSPTSLRVVNDPEVRVSVMAGTHTVDYNPSGGPLLLQYSLYGRQMSDLNFVIKMYRTGALKVIANERGVVVAHLADMLRTFFADAMRFVIEGTAALMVPSSAVQKAVAVGAVEIQLTPIGPATTTPTPAPQPPASTSEYTTPPMDLTNKEVMKTKFAAWVKSLGRVSRKTPGMVYVEYLPTSTTGKMTSIGEAQRIIGADDALPYEFHLRNDEAMLLRPLYRYSTVHTPDRSYPKPSSAQYLETLAIDDSDWFAKTKAKYVNGVLYTMGWGVNSRWNRQPTDGGYTWAQWFASARLDPLAWIDPSTGLYGSS